MNRYHELFFRSASAENLVNLFSRYKGGPKEITESLGLLHAARRLYGSDFSNTTVVVVGDGNSPRTGACFAYLTNAKFVYSIDPEMNLVHWEEHYEKQTKMGYRPERLAVIKQKVEDINWVEDLSSDLLVVWPHSHAGMNDTSKKFKVNSRADLAMPCCVPIPRNWASTPHISFTDPQILSPHNTIHYWGPEVVVPERTCK